MAARRRSTERTGDAPSSFDLQVRCPQCRHAIQVNCDGQLNQITCRECGSTFSLVGDASAGDPTSPPEFVGHFELQEQIGAGAFGAVWKAHDAQLDRTVAVKLPRMSQLDPLREEQFLREARAAAQLQHPHIVQVHEVGRQDDTLFIVSEYVDGGDLSEWLERHTPTPREAALMARDLALALDHAHGAGVIHRDVKPSNVVVDAEGQTHLMDFGLAKRASGEVTMTMDGHILGTPTHMSPEQARGEAHATDRRTDIYSLGVILFQLLTGSLPFEGNAKMLLYHVLHSEPPKPRKLNPRIPRDLETICLKCLEKSPSARYGSAKQVADDLDRFLEGRPVHARPIGSWERGRRWVHRNPALAAMSGVAVGLLLLGAVSFGWQWLRAERNLVEVRAQKDRATRHLRAAQDAVDELLTDIADEMRDLPQTEAIRKRILTRAADINQRFLQDEAIDRGEAGIDTVNAYRRAADIAWQLQDIPATESALRHLISICESTTQPQLARQLAPQHISALCKLAGVAAMRKDWEESSRILHGGLAILDGDPANDTSEVQQMRAEVLRSLGMNAERQGDRTEAGDYYRQAVDRLVAIPSTDEEDTRLLVSRAKVHGSYAIHCKQNARLDEAVQHFGQTQAALVELRQRYPESAEYQSMLAQNEYNLGNVEVAAGNHDEARARYLEAKNHFKQLAQSFPRVVRYRDLWCHCLRAASLASKRPAQLQSRIVMLKKAAFLREEMLRENPESVDNVVQLAKTYRNLGKDLAMADDHPAAIRYLRRSIECGPVAGASDAVRERDLISDAWSCSLLAQLQLDLEDWVQAQHWYRQAMATREPLTLRPREQEDQWRDQAGLGVAIVREGRVEEGLTLIRALPAGTPPADLIAAKGMLNVAEWLSDHPHTATATTVVLQIEALQRLREAWQQGHAAAKEFALVELSDALGETPEYRELVGQMTATPSTVAGLHARGTP